MRGVRLQLKQRAILLPHSMGIVLFLPRASIATGVVCAAHTPPKMLGHSCVPSRMKKLEYKSDLYMLTYDAHFTLPSCAVPGLHTLLQSVKPGKASQRPWLCSAIRVLLSEVRPVLNMSNILPRVA